MAAEFKILDVRQHPVFSPGRVGATDTLVLYQVSGGGSYSVTLQLDQPTEEQIRAAIEADIARRGSLVGKTFPVR